MHAQANLINKIGHQMPNGRHHDHHQSEARQNRDGKPNRKNIHLRRDTRHDAGDDIDKHHGNHNGQRDQQCHAEHQRACFKCSQKHFGGHFEFTHRDQFITRAHFADQQMVTIHGQKNQNQNHIQV